MRGSKARFIDAVVDVVVCPVIRLLDLRLQRFGKECDVLVLLREEVVELPTN